jgi:hypothetical protein
MQLQPRGSPPMSKELEEEIRKCQYYENMASGAISECHDAHVIVADPICDDLLSPIVYVHGNKDQCVQMLLDAVRIICESNEEDDAPGKELP